MKKFAMALVAMAMATPVLAQPMQGMGHEMPQGGPGGPEGPGGMGHRPDPERMFERIDQNHDGVISKAEFMAAHQRMMERRGPGGPGGQRDGMRGGPGTPPPPPGD